MGAYIYGKPTWGNCGDFASAKERGYWKQVVFSESMEDEKKKKHLHGRNH